MGRLDRFDLLGLSRHLRLRLEQASDVSIEYHGRNCHTYNRMFLIASGGGGENCVRNHTTGQVHPLRAGEINFLPRNVDLEFRFCPDMRFVSFHFYLEVFGNIDVFTFRQEGATRADTRGLIPEVLSLLSESGSLGAQCRVCALVQLLAADFLPREDDQAQRLVLLARKYEDLFAYIHHDADATTTIADLAAVADVSRDTLSREFTKDCGVTLKTYLSQSILRRAETLLMEPGATARAVSEALGFNTEYYFSRFFKKHTGLAPGAYRRREH